MRNITDLLINESNIAVNIILNGSGSMGDRDMKESIKMVLKQFGNANLFFNGSLDFNGKTITRTIELKEGMIIAKRHIHMTVADAKNFGVENGQIVKVNVVLEDGNWMKIIFIWQTNKCIK